MLGKSCLLATCLSLVVLQIFADPQHENHGCKIDSDCGPTGATCNRNGDCSCPGTPGKDYVVVPGAKPQCQKVASLGESCNYNDQCHQSSAGPFARCNKNKCECYDTENEGRDVVRPYSGTCYQATALGVDCLHGNQCKAFVEPEDHVVCYNNQTVGRSYCRCIEGQKDCKEKSGVGSVVIGISTLATFAFVGLMATKVVL